ncbi:MAG: serine hydrolase [Pseudomonadota bacterium]
MLRILALILTFTLLMDDAKAQAPETAPDQEAAPMTPLEQRAQDVLMILNGEANGEEVFAPVFLDAVPMAQVDEIARQFTQQFGQAIEVLDIEAKGDTAGIIAVRMERAVGQLNLSVEGGGAHRINGLQLLEFTPTGDTAETITADLLALDGTVSAYFGPLDGARPVLALNPEMQMPLGSAMKLYVLGALGEEVAEGKRAWDDVIALNTKSFPSGQMQDWPMGSPVTLHSFASLMISISDNTATDQLIRLLGRQRIEDYMRSTGHSEAALNTPWLTTRELFLIKGGSQESVAAYADGSTEQRAAIIRTLEHAPATKDEINAKLAQGPVAIETVEWFANTSDLAHLFQTMRAASDEEAFRIMAINPALPASPIKKWDYVGFKGGSETGVLNMTWLLTDAQGRDHLLTLSWANPKAAVETQTLLLMAQRIASLPQ